MIEAIDIKPSYRAIQYTKDNLLEVLEFTGRHPKFNHWFSSDAEYVNYVKANDYVFKLYLTKDTYEKVHPGDWVVITKFGHFLKCSDTDFKSRCLITNGLPFSVLNKAILETYKTTQKYPQPNYVITKWAEESGEVTKELVHFAEGRSSYEALEKEIVQTLAMLIRLYVEGDKVHGLEPLGDYL